MWAANCEHQQAAFAQQNCRLPASAHIRGQLSGGGAWRGGGELTFALLHAGAVCMPHPRASGAEPGCAGAHGQVHLHDCHIHRVRRQQIQQVAPSLHAWPQSPTLSLDTLFQGSCLDLRDRQIRLSRHSETVPLSSTVTSSCPTRAS